VALSVVALAVATGTGVAVFADTATTTTTTTTTTTLPPMEAAQPGWTVMTQSARGVMGDRKVVQVGPYQFEVARFRARTTALHWHAGSEDPPAALVKLPVDSGNRIDLASEGLVGVVGAFNGGFKADSLAGGIISNGLTLSAMKPGYATAVIDTDGHLHIGVWGQDLPSPSIKAVTFRQNLWLLVDNGVVTQTALKANPYSWGTPLHGVVREPRTAIGVDADGNILYVASEENVLPSELAQAMVAAGAVRAMQLDMNPYWPILGMTIGPLWNLKQGFSYVLPGQQHSASVYLNGWTRDFFTVAAEPDAWTCSLVMPGVSKFGVVSPQAFSMVGSNCPKPKG
jgi:hypothetical protein